MNTKFFPTFLMILTSLTIMVLLDSCSTTKGTWHAICVTPMGTAQAEEGAGDFSFRSGAFAELTDAAGNTLRTGYNNCFYVETKK